jgi:hypothetical protein
MAAALIQPDGTSTNAGANVTQAPEGPHPSNAVTALGPDHVLWTGVQYINDDSWPNDYELDIENWEKWSLRISLLADLQGFTAWLNGTLSQPNAATHANAHHIWAINDLSLRACILSHVSHYDYESVSHLPTSHAVFEELRKMHEHSQIILVKKAMDICFRPHVPLSKTVEEIDALHFKIVNMGPIDNDQLKAVFLLNALKDDFEDLQFHLMCMADDPSFSSKTIIRRLHQEDSLMRRRAEQNSQTPSTTFAAQGRGKRRPACTNCKKLGHLVDFCTQPGGKMAGRSIEEARTAQRALANKQPRTGQQ